MVQTPQKRKNIQGPGKVYGTLQEEAVPSWDLQAANSFLRHTHQGFRVLGVCMPGRAVCEQAADNPSEARGGYHLPGEPIEQDFLLHAVFGRSSGFLLM